MSAGDFIILCIPISVRVDYNTINLLNLYRPDGLFRFYGYRTTILVFHIIYVCLVIVVIIIYFGDFLRENTTVISGDVPAAGIRERFLYAYFSYL